MREIWRHSETGWRYLVEVRYGRAATAFGALRVGGDPRAVLFGGAALLADTWVLLHMRAAPGEYVREYASDPAGNPIRLTGEPPAG